MDPSGSIFYRDIRCLSYDQSTIPIHVLLCCKILKNAGNLRFNKVLDFLKNLNDFDRVELETFGLFLLVSSRYR